MASSRVQTQLLTEFHLFPRLPTEVRWMIWSYLFPSRLIDIFAHVVETWTGAELDSIPKRFELDINPEPGQNIQMERVFARLYPTPLSAVNSEARSFLPAGYIGQISTDLDLPEDYMNLKCPEIPNQRRFFVNEQYASNFTKINFKQDVLFLRPLGSQQAVLPMMNRSFAMSQTLDIFLRWVPEAFRKSVRHLAINENESYAWDGRPFDGIANSLLKLPNLETLWIVYDEYREIEMDCPYHPTKILRGRDRAERLREWAANWYDDWAYRCDKLAKEHVEWNYPEIRMVKNTKTIRRSLWVQDGSHIFYREQ